MDNPRRHPLKRIRIVSDGKSTGTRVEDADTGEDLSYLVSEGTWTCKAGGVGTATLTFPLAEVDVVGELASCAVCGNDEPDGGWITVERMRVQWVFDSLACLSTWTAKKGSPVA